MLVTVALEHWKVSLAFGFFSYPYADYPCPNVLSWYDFFSKPVCLTAVGCKHNYTFSKNWFACKNQTSICLSH